MRSTEYIGELEKDLRYTTAIVMCRVCGNPAGDYQVDDEVWAAADLHPRAGAVCIDCLDIRLIRIRHVGLQTNECPPVAANQALRFGASLLRARNALPLVRR